MVRRERRWLHGGLLAVAAAVLLQLLGQVPAAAAPRVLYYDASRAAEFVSVVHEGAAAWNNTVSNVRLMPVPAGVRANIVVTADDAWPRAITTSLGNGRWIMGRQAVRDGHYPPRIASHEFGHLLGLPDRRTGLCVDLMSGSSAGTACRSVLPNAAERRRVDTLFQSAATVRPAAFID